MKRILIFSLAYYPRVGGAEVAIKEITDRVAPSDVAFDMLTLRFSAKDPLVETIGNVRIYRVVGYKFTYPLFAAIGAYRLHKKNKYDAAWCMMSYMLFPVVLLRMAGVRLPYALTLQEGDPFRHMFGRVHILPFRPLLAWGFRHAAVVQVISTYLAGWAKRMGYRGDIRVIPNGVDIARFAPAEVRTEGASNLTLVTSSRLVRKNGIDLIIRALPLVPGTTLVVCGDGPDEAALKALAKALGVADRIHWRGYVSHGELPRHLHHAGIFVRPSRSEGMGNSFVEAMAAGLPVIATQVGGLADFITPAVAWPVRPESPEDIAAAVREIAAHPADAAQRAARARELARERYDWDIIATEMRQEVFDTIA